MTYEYPPSDDLIKTARDFVASIKDDLTGEKRYHALVTIYLLDIVHREMTSKPVNSKVGRRFHEDEVVFRDELRSGVYDDREQELVDAILADLIANIEVIRPDYLDDVEQ